MGKLTILNDSGDVTVEWEPEDAESVEQARKEWAALAEAGFEFFQPKKGGGRGRRVKNFNGELGWVIAAPGVQKKKDVEHAKRTHAPRKREKAMAGGPRAAATFEGSNDHIRATGPNHAIDVGDLSDLPGIARRGR